MSSPFSLFRRHQRILMVVTTGLAMISFVLLGAISDPRDMPMPLVVIFLAAMLGGIFWLAGLSRGKGSDWGLTGVILGVVLGLVMIYAGQEASAVTLDGGNLTRSELTQLMRNRQVANSFVQMAATAALPEGGDDTAMQQAQVEASQRIQRNLFGFNRQMDVTAQDVVLGEVLRREANEIGMIISDDIVKGFIQDVSGGMLTGNAFKKIRRNLQVSETALMDILRQELKAREAARLLSGQTYITPQNQWEFYQKLNVKVAAELVEIPVSSFVKDAEPTADELQNLLNQYRENMPGFTPEGRPDEGRPGFFQPPKMQVAYLEAVFDDIKATVGDVTEEEIQKRYEEEYPQEAPADEPGEMKGDEATQNPANSGTLPALPDRSATEETKKPAEAAESKTTLPAEPKTNEAAETKPASEEKTKTEEKTQPEEKPATPDAEQKGTESSSDAQQQSSRGVNLDGLQFVAFQDEAADKPATEDKPTAEEKPATTAPAEQKAEQPAKTDAEKAPPATDEKPAADEKSAEKAPATEDKPEPPPAPLKESDLPPPPTSDIPELDDELKQQLKEDILRERTQAKIAKLMDDAAVFVNELSRRYRLGEIEEEYISLDEATVQIKQFAEENNLEYLETPYLSLSELRTSEDYPIGSAMVMSSAGGRQTVADQLAQSVPAILFNVGRAMRFNIGGDAGFTVSNFIFWKTGFQEAYAPKTIEDEPAVREQLVKVWEIQQADDVAKQRAEELAKLVNQSDQPLAEVVAEETVTGEEGSLFLTVRETGEFTMMTQGAAPQANPFQQGPPRYSVVTGAEDAGERFFKTVFEELDEGEAGFAPNRDGSAYYVIKIKDRMPSSKAEMDEMRADFLKQGEQFAYFYMSQQLLSEFAGDWGRELLEKYDVQFYSDDPAVASEGEDI